MSWKEPFKNFPAAFALGALFVYLVTLSPGATVANLTLTAKITGWDYQPLANQPLLWLLTLPLRLLPTAIIPLGLNLIAAIAAAATLYFLLATLQLVAWDRPLTTLNGWRARLPLLLGGILCGLEFRFWQAATQNNGEAIQILLFAIGGWCLLQYRASNSSRWLKLGCFVWGMGMAENWAMILLLPFFVVTIFLIGRERLLNRSLLVKLALLGLAGFSIVILPVIGNALIPGSPWNLLDSGRETFNGLKNPLKATYLVCWRSGKLALLAVAIFYLLAVLPMIIRLPDSGTKNLGALDRYQIWLTRALRGTLMLMLIWVMLNPAVGLREILSQKFNLTLPLLTLDYLGAIAAAILCGNLLLSLASPPVADYPGSERRAKRLPALAISIGAVLLVLTAASLVWRNAAAITLPQRQPFASYGKMVLAQLPEKNGVLLSDDTLRFYSICAAGAGRADHWPVINTEWLAQPGYFRHLTNACPEVQFIQLDSNQVPAVNMTITLATIVQSNTAYYIHPSFGPWFERYYLRPAGLPQRLQAYTDRAFSPPPLTADQIQAAEIFWDTATPRLDALEASCKADAKYVFGPLTPLCRKLQLKPYEPIQSKLLAEWYSIALNDWGVQLQRAGRLDAAHKRFQQALDLNSRNGAAQINRLSNSNLLAARTLNLAWYPALNTELGDSRKLTRFLKLNGLVDEPAFCYLLAKSFGRSGLPRQAFQLLLRANALAPNTPAVQIELAGLYARYGFEEESRKAIRIVREKLPSSFMQTNATLDVSLSLLEAGTWLQSSNAAQSKEILQSVLDERPDDAQTAFLILKAYLAAGDFESAMELTDKQLQKNPADRGWLLQKAFILDRSGKPAVALDQLNRLLATTNFPPALLLRSKIFISLDQWDKSEADLQNIVMEKDFTPLAQLGLAEISLHRRDTNAALEHLRLGYESVPANSRYAQLLQQKIIELKPVASPTR